MYDGWNFLYLKRSVYTGDRIKRRRDSSFCLANAEAPSWRQRFLRWVRKWTHTTRKDPIQVTFAISMSKQISFNGHFLFSLLFSFLFSSRGKHSENCRLFKILSNLSEHKQKTNSLKKNAPPKTKHNRWKLLLLPDLMAFIFFLNESIQQYGTVPFVWAIRPAKEWRSRTGTFFSFSLTCPLAEMLLSHIASVNRLFIRCFCNDWRHKAVNTHDTPIV